MKVAFAEAVAATFVEGLLAHHVPGVGRLLFVLVSIGVIPYSLRLDKESGAAYERKKSEHADRHRDAWRTGDPSAPPALPDRYEDFLEPFDRFLYALGFCHMVGIFFLVADWAIN